MQRSERTARFEGQGRAERRHPSAFGSQRLRSATALEQDEARRRLPREARRQVESRVSSPIYAWFADVGEARCEYAGVGPAGFCIACGERGWKGWSIEHFARTADPTSSRWFSETDLSPRRTAGMGKSEAAAARTAGGVQNRFEEDFVETFGLLPPTTQAFFQEALAPSTSPPWARSFWHASWSGYVLTFQVWCAAATDATTAFAHGSKQARFVHGWPTWEAAQDALAETPMAARATWTTVPTVTTAPPAAYTILGVTPDAPDEVIRTRYRTLAKQLHPDRASGSPFEAARKFRELQHAWSQVGPPGARARYDASLRRTAPVPHSVGRVGWWNNPRPERASRPTAGDAAARTRAARAAARTR